MLEKGRCIQGFGGEIWREALGKPARRWEGNLKWVFKKRDA